MLLCLFGGAVDLEDVRRWADQWIATIPAPPLWLIDVSGFRECPAHIYRVIGHAPDREFNEQEEAAVAGIAVARGLYSVEALNLPCSLATARIALESSPAVREEFVRNFPFSPARDHVPRGTPRGAAPSLRAPIERTKTGIRFPAPPLRSPGNPGAFPCGTESAPSSWYRPPISRIGYLKARAARGLAHTALGDLGPDSVPSRRAGSKR